MSEHSFPTPAARNSDPETSHAAAADASFRASRHRILALETLYRHGGLTDFELASITGMQQNSIGKRRGDCRDVGLVTNLRDADGIKMKRPAPSGSGALVWTLTAEGINYIQDYWKRTKK
jgi:hypothetical protein